MMWFCGFNGFQQFNYLVDCIQDNEENEFIPKFLKSQEESYMDVAMTWSNLLVIRDNCVTLSGFLNGKTGQSLHLETPDKQVVIQGTCDKNNCLLITNQGRCWQYNLITCIWKEIKYICTNVPSNSEQCDGVIKVVLGEIINAALSNKGRVWNIGNQLSPAEMKVIDIDCGKEHGLLLTDNGGVFTWGGGSRGQLGNGTLESSEDLCEIELLAGIKVVKIAAGGWHSAVLTKDGDVYTWGWNKQGQLGHPTLNGDNTNGVAVLSEPRVVDWPQSQDVYAIEVSCGTSHTVTLLENGEIWGCGWNKWGQLGTTKFKSTYLMTKLEISPLKSIKKVICDAWNTVIICEDL